MFIISLLPFLLLGNNIQIANVQINGQNTTDKYTYLQFDISWENSWRISTGPSNWDAAWVFVKYTTDGINWYLTKLNNTGNIAPSGSKVQVGLIDEGVAFNNTTNPATGAYIYRSTDGSGTFSLSSVKLRWNYGENGLADLDIVSIRVYAIEMVYIPQGSFYLGSGGTENYHFYTYPNTTTPYSVTSDSAISVGATNGYLYYDGMGDKAGPIPGQFPKGYNAFYLMKYELNQGQYVDFLNSLISTDASLRFANTNSYRNAITYNSTSQIYETTNPYVPNNYMDWEVNRLNLEFLLLLD